MHVLVVDDEPAFREVLCRMLESVHDVREAESGEEALRMMAEERPAVVLLDLYLPGLGGMQVLRHMKQDPGLGDVPVIVISGMDDVENKVSALEAGPTTTWSNRWLGRSCWLASPFRFGDPRAVRSLPQDRTAFRMPPAVAPCRRTRSSTGDTS